MCGRFVSTLSSADLSSIFDAVSDLAVEPAPRYNITPTSTVVGVVPMAGVRRLRALRWGLVPSWASDPSIGQRMINARAETLTEKRSFRDLLPAKRCVIPMDGFYEWAPGRPGGSVGRSGQPLKQPYYIHRRDSRPLAVAGLWTRWTRGDEPIESVTIITCAANPDVAEIHHRMPVLLDDEDLDLWLDDGVDDVRVVSGLLDPAPVGSVVAEAVSTTVNSARSEGAELIVPVGDTAG